MTAPDLPICEARILDCGSSTNRGAQWTTPICPPSQLLQVRQSEASPQLPRLGLRITRRHVLSGLQATARQEHLYGEFIDEAAKLVTDALTHELDDPSKLVCLYALVGKLRLFASAEVISQAEEVMHWIVENYGLPNRDFRNPESRRQQSTDVLRAFSEACRRDLCV
jgi:hypothetical protein